MSLVRSLFKVGFGLVVAGFLLSFVSRPLGLGLAQLGMVIIGSIVLVPVLGVVLALLPFASGDSDDQEWNVQPRGQQRSIARQQGRSEQGQRPDWSAQRDQPDLDVSTIDDYRR